MQYRDATPTADATFWYGPFEARWWRLVASLVVLVVGIVAAVQLETTTFRRLECQRPGQCVVIRGGSLFGGHAAEAFAVDSVETAKLRRTTGKSPHDVLVLVLRGGSEVELFTGSRVQGELPRVQAYFAGAASSLIVTGDSQPGMTVLCAAVSIVGAVLAALFLLLGLRASVRYRVSILAARGVLRIERIVGGAPRDPREVPLANIVDVAIEGASGEGDRGEGARMRPARVVLCTREGLDVPICEHFHKGASAHRALAEDLRLALRLAPP